MDRFMNKKHITIAVVVGVILCAGLGILIYTLWQEKAEKEELLMLAEMDKREMENEYASFAKQYSEMKTQINNDSSQATVWVKNGEQISQRQITTGINDGINIIVTSGLDEGQEVVLSATMEKQAKGEPTNLMPGPGRRR